ncbi:MAG: MBL fold metallo-hydrolase [Deferrisomatales bacterium]
MRSDTGRRRVLELRPGIFQFVGQKPSCHAYLIRGRAKNVLIDTGLPGSAPHLTECLTEVGLGVGDVHLVVLTHEHLDHVGCAPGFYQTAVLAAHSLAANKIALRDEFVMMNRAFDHAADAFQVDLCLDGGATVELGNYRLQILHTPGHSSGSICLYEPDHRLLFTGDTLMAGGVMGGIFGSGNISDYINTLRGLSTLRVDAFFPGHGRVSTEPDADLGQAISRSTTLLQDSRALFDALHAKEHFTHIFRSARDLNA